MSKFDYIMELLEIGECLNPVSIVSLEIDQFNFALKVGVRGKVYFDDCVDIGIVTHLCNNINFSGIGTIKAKCSGDDFLRIIQGYW